MVTIVILPYLLFNQLNGIILISIIFWFQVNPKGLRKGDFCLGIWQLQSGQVGVDRKDEEKHPGLHRQDL
jgi:hypothetical protein